MARKNITKHYRKLQHFDKNDELCSLEIKRVLVGYPILYSFIYLALTQQPLQKDMCCGAKIYVGDTREKTEKSVREESK